MNRTHQIAGIVVVILIIILAAAYLWLQMLHAPTLENPLGMASTTPSGIATATPGMPSSGSGAPAQVTPLDPSVPSSGTYSNVVLSLNAPMTFYGDLTLTPTGVTEDSRCPSDPGIRCIQAGTVRVSLNVKTPSGTNVQTIGLGQSITAGSETITLNVVTPDKWAGRTIAPSDYRFVFSVSKNAQAVGKPACVIGGCSSELCVDPSTGPTMSNCIYQAKFACYRAAICERQPTGQCGWTPTPALQACLANPEAS